MTLRELVLPKDLLRITAIAAETWHYPENPEWSVQPDEEESLEDSVENYQRSGRNTIHAHLDPAHPALAQFLMDHMLHQIANANPERTIEFNIPIPCPVGLRFLLCYGATRMSRAYLGR